MQLRVRVQAGDDVAEGVRDTVADDWDSVRVREGDPLPGDAEAVRVVERVRVTVAVEAEAERRLWLQVTVGDGDAVVEALGGLAARVALELAVWVAVRVRVWLWVDVTEGDSVRVEVMLGLAAAEVDPLHVALGVGAGDGEGEWDGAETVLLRDRETVEVRVGLWLKVMDGGDCDCGDGVGDVAEGVGVRVGGETVMVAEDTEQDALAVTELRVTEKDRVGVVDKEGGVPEVLWVWVGAVEGVREAETVWNMLRVCDDDRDGERDGCDGLALGELVQVRLHVPLGVKVVVGSREGVHVGLGLPVREAVWGGVAVGLGVVDGVADRAREAVGLAVGLRLPVPVGTGVREPVRVPVDDGVAVRVLLGGVGVTLVVARTERESVRVRLVVAECERLVEADRVGGGGLAVPVLVCGLLRDADVEWEEERVAEVERLTVRVSVGEGLDEPDGGLHVELGLHERVRVRETVGLREDEAVDGDTEAEAVAVAVDVGVGGLRVPVRVAVLKLRVKEEEGVCDGAEGLRLRDVEAVPLPEEVGVRCGDAEHDGEAEGDSVRDREGAEGLGDGEAERVWEVLGDGVYVVVGAQVQESVWDALRLRGVGVGDDVSVTEVCVAERVTVGVWLRDLLRPVGVREAVHVAVVLMLRVGGLLVAVALGVYVTVGTVVGVREQEKVAVGGLRVTDRALEWDAEAVAVRVSEGVGVGEAERVRARPGLRVGVADGEAERVRVRVGLVVPLMGGE